MNSSPPSGHSDIPTDHWTVRLVPQPWRPYVRLARLDRPIGTWLLLLPCWWSLALASDGFDVRALWYGALFALGALVMRGAGCAVNDIADRDFDSQVERTRNRPIASGQISRSQAAVFVAVLCLVGLAVLVQFNLMTVLVGAASLVLVFPYPLMKRITHWPQAWLGLTFNWGALVGWCAVKGEVTTPALILYAAGVFWTLGYDTIYAHQDKEDDLAVGVKSTALALGDRTAQWTAVFYALAWGGIVAACALSGMDWEGLVLLVPAGWHLAAQIQRLDIDDPVNCLSIFRSNRDFGLLVLVGILAAKYLWGAI